MRDPLLWALVGFALLFRVGYNLALHGAGHSPAGFVIDEREYFGAAHVLAEGRGFSFFDTALWVRPPLYVLFLAPFTGDASGTTALMAVQSLISALTLLPLAMLSFRLAGLASSRWTALLAALYLPFTLFAGLVLSETLFVFLFALGVVALLGLGDALRAEDSRRALFWAVGAGLLLGLAVLTRATALAFLPLAALWVLAVNRRGPELRRAVLPTAALVGACVLVLVPWTVRNYAAYHRLVLVDTTSGYNLWLGSVGVRDEPRLQADLQPIANPADKQAFAYAQAFNNIKSDPSFFVRKGLKESLDLWSPVFQAEEHQVGGFGLGRIPAWHLYSIFALDDVLYLAVMLLAIAGLLGTSGGGLRGLTLLWVLLWVAMSFVFFAVTRFRLPVVALLIPWAGAGMATLLARRKTAWLRSVPLWQRGLGAVAAVATLVVLLPGMVFTWQQAGIGAQRWSAQAPYREAEVILRQGKADEAIRLYKQADISLIDTRYGLAAAYLEAGQAPEALAQLTNQEPSDRFEPLLIRGQAARLSGDLAGARLLFNERVVKLAGDQALVWAWDHFQVPPTARIDTGSGLDIGYVRGFGSPETASDGTVYRWSGGAAQVRGLQSGSSTLTVSGWRPGGTAPAHLDTADGKESSLPQTDTWQAQAISGTNFTTNVFVPGGSDPRLLGVRVRSIAAGPTK